MERQTEMWRQISISELNCTFVSVMQACVGGCVFVSVCLCEWHFQQTEVVVWWGGGGGEGCKALTNFNLNGSRIKTSWYCKNTSNFVHFRLNYNKNKNKTKIVHFEWTRWKKKQKWRNKFPKTFFLLSASQFYKAAMIPKQWNFCSYMCNDIQGLLTIWHQQLVNSMDSPFHL